MTVQLATKFIKVLESEVRIYKLTEIKNEK